MNLSDLTDHQAKASCRKSSGEGTLLRAEHVNRYARDGYLLIDNFLSRVEIHALKDGVRSLPSLLAGRHVFTDPSQSPTYDALARDVHLLGAVGQLLEVDAVGLNSLTATDRPLTPIGSWDRVHTSVGLSGADAESAAVATIFLDAGPAASGAFSLVLVPGSHHERQVGVDRLLRLPQFAAPGAKVTVDVQPGALLILHPHLVLGASDAVAAQTRVDGVYRAVRDSAFERLSAHHHGTLANFLAWRDEATRLFPRTPAEDWQ